MKLLLVLLILAISSGCAASVKGKSTVTYQQDGFTPQAIKQAGIAIMPVVAGRGVEGYRRPFADSLQSTLKTHAPKGTQVMGWQDTAQALNDANLIEAYNKLVESYVTTAILDKKVLQQIKDATGKRFFLVVVLGDFAENSTTTHSGGSTNVTTEVKINATAYVWDADKGDVVWEAMGGAGATAHSGGFMIIETRDPIVYGQKASEAIVGSLVGKDLSDLPTTTN